MGLRSLCLLALLFAGTAHAQVPLPDDEEAMTPEQAAQMQAAEDAAQSYYSRIATDLAASGKSRELALAATLLQFATPPPPSDDAMVDDTPSQPSPRDPRADTWRRLASARAGKDVLVNALLMQADDSHVGRQAAERWRQLEPDNLAPLLFRGSSADGLLAATSSTSRFDLHMYAQVRWIQSALQAHPPSAAERAILFGGEDVALEDASALAAMGIWSAVALPSLRTLVDACRGTASATGPTQHEECRHVAQVMADASDTSLGRSIGIRLLELTASTPGQQDDAATRRRRIDWQMQQWAQLSGKQPLGGAHQLGQLLRDPAVGTEQDLVERILGEAGIPLDPPVGWQSPQR
jgi:hypothetical protein